MPPMTQAELDNLNKLFATISNGINYGGGTVVGSTASSLKEFCEAIDKLTRDIDTDSNEIVENEWEEISC